MQGALDQVRFAARSLRKSPGFTLIAVLTFALGIGANTSIFTVMNTIMLRPLPYAEPNQLVSIYRTAPQSQRWPHSVANFLDYRSQNPVFDKMAAFGWRRFSLAQPGQPAESVRGMACTADYFSILGVPAELGRTFAPDEDQPGRDAVVVLSHTFWMRQFGADPRIVGKTIRLDAQPLTVIGVMPASFDVPQLWSPISAWRPLTFSSEERQDRGNNYLMAFGRVKPGVSVAQADAAMKSLADRLAKTYPASNAQNSLRIIPLNESIGDESSRRFSWLMLCLTGFVLMIACVNLANLQLARAAIRSRELAVRLALGSGRWRLMWQLLCESLLIAAVGGVSGILISMWLSNFIGKQLDRWSPEGIAMPTDWRVLSFAIGCALATGIIFGLGPAWIASRANVNDALKAGSRGSTTGRSQHFLRHSLIVGEVALALVLLTGSTLFVGGLRRFVDQKPGWATDHLLTGWVPLSTKYTDDAGRPFVKLLEQRLTSIPGVKQAAIASSVPIWAFGSSRSFLIEGQPLPPQGQDPLTSSEAVTPGYFSTMGIQLLQGRVFSDDDDQNRPNVVVINQAMAKKFWPNESPIGKRIGFDGREKPNWMQVVGVVNDLRFPANLNKPDTLWQSYRPLAQETRGYYALQIRTTAAPASLASAVRQVVAEIDPDVPVNELEPADILIERVLGHFTLAGKLLVGFANLGLVLAALGIYGVISFLVVQRTGEIGIRMALGAQRPDVLWLILKKGLSLTAIGIGLGLIGAYAIASLLAAAVPEVPSKDPFAVLTVAFTLIAVGIGAAGIPAWRATRYDPTVALRCE